MIQSNVSMQEMSLVCGWLAQMAKDFSEGTDESEGAKEDRARMRASFIETARYIVAMFAGHVGGNDQALVLIQQVMAAYGDSQIEYGYDEDDEDEDDEDEENEEDEG